MNIQSIGDLLTALRALDHDKINHEIYVPNNIRKKFLIEHDNRFVSKATVREVDWENAGSGVWIPTIV